jgi:hypothetical protein
MSELKYVVDHYCSGSSDCLHCEILRLKELVKSAFIEGWTDGHNYGIGCGHALAPKCNHNGSIEWCESDSLEALVKT